MENGIGAVGESRWNGDAIGWRRSNEIANALRFPRRTAIYMIGKLDVEANDVRHPFDVDRLLYKPSYAGFGQDFTRLRNDTDGEPISSSLHNLMFGEVKVVM